MTGKDCGILGQFPAWDQIYFTAINVKGDTVRFTKLPSEKMDTVGTKDAPAARNTKLELDYQRK